MSATRFPTPTERAKRAKLLELLEGGGWVRIHLNPKAEGVELPAHLMDLPQVALDISHALGRALEMKPLAIEALLTFGGESARCVVPLDSIFAALDHGSDERVLFPEALPARARFEVEPEPEAVPKSELEPETDPPGGSGPPKLTLVK